MKWFKWLILAVGSVAAVPILWFWWALAVIKFKPLPPIPRDTVLYQIRDAGANGQELNAFYGNTGRFGWQLTEAGRVILDDSNEQARENAWKSAREQRAQNLGVESYDVTGFDAKRTLVQRLGTLELWRGKSRVASCKTRLQSYAKWPVYDAKLMFFGVGQTIIGNGRMATAFASSCGTSEPHGRMFPIVWDGKSAYLRDFNGEIDAKSGWYLHRALSSTSAAKSCASARKPMRATPKHRIIKRLHQLILTPIEAR